VNPRAQIAHADQTPASTAAVKRLHDLGRGVIVVYPTPGRGGEGIARDVLAALGKRFRDRTPRDPRRLVALGALWLRAERIRELVIAGAERRPVSEWTLLRSLCSEAGPRLTMIVEQPASDGHLAVLGGSRSRRGDPGVGCRRVGDLRREREPRRSSALSAGA
jgi:hypothetical protein